MRITGPWRFPGYFPSCYFASVVVNRGVLLAMLGTNAWSMAGAMTEYVFTCKDCLAEHLRQNQVYLGSSSTASYLIVSTKKIASLDELKGKKLRSGAAPFARWAQNFGAVALTIPGNEVFEAVAQGTVDGAMVSATELTNLRLIDVVKHIAVGVPSGTYHGIDNNNVNRATWNSLSEAQRKSFIEAAAVSSAAVTWKYVTDGARNMKDAQVKGIQIHQASADMEQAALAEIYRREIYSKIDLKTHGM